MGARGLDARGRRGSYLIGRIRGGDVGAISSPPEGAPPVAAWNTYIWVDDADATAKQVVEAGGSVLAEPFDVGDAGRMAILADTEGAVFSVWQARAHRGSKIVNEHGAVNFNGLACRDVAAAGASTARCSAGSTSRSRAAPCGCSPATATTSRSPRPASRSRWQRWARRMASSTSSPRCCRSRRATTTPPHWNVTFATDDVEATAARATELGAEVLVGPVDAPWVRMAVIRDPQGAMFIASQFVPENATPS